MQLNAEQIQEFEQSGYLFFPRAFSAAETAVLKQAALDVYQQRREEVWREKSGVARTAFAAHTYNDAFRRLGAHPRLIEPVMQLLDGPVYMHQYKVNAKAAFDGDVWQWHQDYGTWARDDLMPEPRAMNIAVFLDDRLGYGNRNPVKRWWLDLELVDGKAQIPAGTNERDLTLTADTSGKKSPVGYYNAADMPRADQREPVLVNHKQAIDRSRLIETVELAKERRASGGAKPAHYDAPAE